MAELHPSRTVTSDKMINKKVNEIAKIVDPDGCLGSHDTIMLYGDPQPGKWGYKVTVSRFFASPEIGEEAE